MKDFQNDFNGSRGYISGDDLIPYFNIVIQCGPLTLNTAQIKDYNNWCIRFRHNQWNFKNKGSRPRLFIGKPDTNNGFWLLGTPVSKTYLNWEMVFEDIFKPASSKRTVVSDNAFEPVWTVVNYQYHVHTEPKKEIVYVKQNWMDRLIDENDQLRKRISKSYPDDLTSEPDMLRYVA
jgi:hypothetical protein